jgi:predicted dehydrogenase
VSPPDIGVGMLGYAFMGKAHAHAYRTLSYMTWPPPLVPRLVGIAGRDAEAVAEAARRYGFDDHATDWRELVADERVELFDNVASNRLHAEPTIAAAEAGKHVVCEKPLGMTADESYEIWQRVAAAGVRHMCLQLALRAGGAARARDARGGRPRQVAGFVHELHHLLAAIGADRDVEPHGASLRDGYRASEVADGVVRSAEMGARVELSYRDA